MSAELNIRHNAGFFSCCSVRLTEIVNFFNKHKREPLAINCDQQFAIYKNNLEEDINSIFFNPTIEPILYKTYVDYHWEHQFIPYFKLDFESITPFIKKYFNVSDYIQELTCNIEKTYDINYANIIGVCYRGNDKCTETSLASYDEFIYKCQEITQIIVSI